MKNLLFLFACLLFALASTANPYKPTVQDLKDAQTKISQSYIAEKIALKPTKTENIFEVFCGAKLLGKVYFRILAPHGEDFTYFALLNSNRTVLSFGVLMYDCSTGQEVTTAKWGKRLIGKKAKSLSIGADVDAVSGGTMTVEAILEDLELL